MPIQLVSDKQIKCGTWTAPTSLKAHRFHPDAAARRQHLIDPEVHFEKAQTRSQAAKLLLGR